MTRLLLLPAVVACTLLEAPASARKLVLDIPDGRLDRALVALSRQAGIAIGGISPGLASVRTRSVRGTLTLEQALRRMLRDTRFDFRIIDAKTVRLVPRPLRPTTPPRPKPPPPLPRRTVLRPLPPAVVKAGPEPIDPEIVITATKQSTPLDRYAGSATVLDVGAGTGVAAVRGLESLVGRLSTTASTNLGPGRNKLFVRGIADSSFNGPTQSTTGLYVGELRLIYSAPDPDLRLYDIERVEVLEGPQGTLYGAGALGGIVRVVPRRPDMDAQSATVWAGAATTRAGGVSHDLAAMINVPVTRRAAVRVVAYTQRDAGYVDDSRRGLSDVNSADITGWRGTLRLEPGDDWAIELGGLAQFIDTADSQYASRDLPPLTRASALAQPFDLDVTAYSATVTKQWGDIALVSATGMVRSDIDTIFDATALSPSNAPTLFDEARKVRFLNHETRLSRSSGTGLRWVGGVSLIENVDESVRRLGSPGQLADIAGTKARTREAALFGEISVPIARALTGTIGGRLVHTANQSERATDAGDEIEPKATDLRVLPTVAAAWRPMPGGLAYVRYQEGFRASGISIGDGSAPEIQRFRPDELRTVEAGARLGGSGRPLSLAAAVFHTKWESIQSDVIDARGFPRTVNIGEGRIYGVSADFGWRPTRAVELQASLFFNESALTEPAFEFEGDDERSLPNVAKIGARGSVTFETPLARTVNLVTQGQLSYVGESHLGVGSNLDIDQGNYVVAGASARLTRGRFSLVADVSNLFDSRANTFSLGNPFTVAEGRQITPLRPRTVRIGVEADF